MDADVLSATPLPLDLALSLVAAEKTGASVKQCWTNAVRALRTHAALKEGLYVEGWAVLDVALPIEHAWVELPDRIVDPTYALILNRETAHPAYFAGVRYTRERLKGVRATALPFVYTFGGWGGYQHAPYKKAYFDAWVYCGKPEIGQDPLLG